MEEESFILSVRLGTIWSTRGTGPCQGGQRPLFLENYAANPIDAACEQ